MRHFMTYEFIYEFMYMKNIVKSYLNSCAPRFQMAWPRQDLPLSQLEAVQRVRRAGTQVGPVTGANGLHLKLLTG